MIYLNAYSVARIDLLAVLNTGDFDLKERGQRILITPKKSKHVWTDDELPLRSLVVDREGHVLSSGFSKFLNYGERPEHDAEFRDAVSGFSEYTPVQFPEKLDGSLIIVDVIDGKVEFRTRGNDCLGEFEAPVMALIRDKYPNFEEGIIEAGWKEYSILFEYISPTNRIVVPYTEPELVLLGVMNKFTLRPYWGKFALADIAKLTGTRVAPCIDLPNDFTELMKFVRGWKDKEGVVARFYSARGPRMVKIKADQYVRLHALKFKLTGNVGKLLYMLGAETEEQAKTRLFELGVDAEAQQFVAGEITAYIEQYKTLERLYERFCRSYVQNVAATEGYGGTRKEAALLARMTVEVEGFPQSFFHAAMKVFDGNPAQGWALVVGCELLKESQHEVRKWTKDPKESINAILNVPVVEDE